MQAIDELRPYLETEFQRRLLDGASQSLSALGNPLRLNNFSAAFRELVRHVFDHLAPNEEIKRCGWYRPEPNSATGVTRGHRVSFVIHGGISPRYAQVELDIDVGGERKSLVSAVDALSKFTHVNPATFDLPADKVEKHVADACAALKSMLLAAHSARKALAAAIESKVEMEVIHAVLNETVASVDEISSHHTIEEVSLDEVKVVRIGATEIEFVAHGVLEVGLQWGSNSDVRNDMGAVGSDSFPLTLKLVSSVTSPADIEAVEDSLSVDTSNWYDDDDYSDVGDELSDMVPI